MARPAKRIGLARAQRKAIIPAEKMLWRALRNRALGGFKFRRQHPIGAYVVDFACVECKLIVEIDGETHLDRRNEDNRRTRFLETEGWQVLRFWNTEVYDDFEPVKEAIYSACVARTEAPPAPLTPGPSPPAREAADSAKPNRAGGEGRPVAQRRPREQPASPLPRPATAVNGRNENGRG
jgi:very-short-patch-repair endonuclease